MRTLIVALATAVLAVGCAGAPATQPTPVATPTTQPATPAATPVTTPTASPTATGTPELPDLVGEVPEEILLEIMQETSRATGANLAELTILRAEAVTWSDGALGCPEPGESYIQVLIDGYWVEIEAGGDVYDFRVSEDGDWRVCPSGQGRPPVEEQY
jgi:hypothetical protein